MHGDSKLRKTAALQKSLATTDILPQIMRQCSVIILKKHRRSAKEVKLCRHLRKITNRFIFAFGLIFAAGLFFGAEIYARIFVKKGAVIGMITHGLKLFVPVFLLQGFNMIGSMYFTSCGMAKESAIISSARGIVILIITIFVFSALWGLDGIWLTAPATEAFTVGITLHFIGINLHLV